jgi:hypothetical protein
LFAVRNASEGGALGSLEPWSSSREKLVSVLSSTRRQQLLPVIALQEVRSEDDRELATLVSAAKANL